MIRLQKLTEILDLCYGKTIGNKDKSVITLCVNTYVWTPIDIILENSQRYRRVYEKYEFILYYTLNK
jgi:hypothetical protein